MVKQPGIFSLGAAHVVLVEGFASTAVWAFMNTALLPGRPARPNRVFREVETAVAWLVPLLTRGEQRWTHAELAALVARMEKGPRG